MDSNKGFSALFLLLLRILAIVVRVSGQLTTESIYIDCGKPKNYADGNAELGVSYISDFDYIDTGEIHDIHSEFSSSYSNPSNDLRSFPSGQRNCYNIKPVREGKKYLVRVVFMYGNYDGRNQLPKFDLHLGANFWDTVSIGNASDYTYKEVMTVARSSSLSLCLVNTDSGTPFVSGIELRRVADSFFHVLNATQTLVLDKRINYGASSSTLIRYPNDTYDRIWWGDRDYTLSTTLNTSADVAIDNDYNPPQAVMQTAKFATEGSNLKIIHSVATTARRPKPRSFVFLHFAELQLLKDNESRIFDIIINEDKYNNFSPTYLGISTIGNIIPKYYESLQVTMVKTTRSTLPPIMNAAEFFVLMEMTEQETDVGDMSAIMDIKSVYKIKRNWQGDPCAPKSFSWDGLNCSYGNSSGPRIISLDISSSGLGGEIASSIANLTELRVLNLSGNKLTGGIPEFLANLQHLKILNLTSNNLSGSIPKALLSRSRSGSLTLCIGDNPDLFEDKTKKSSKKAIILGSSIGAVIVFLVVTATIVTSMLRKKHPAGLLDKKLEEDLLHGREFTYKELIKVTSGFRTEIGKGGFGPVYHGYLDHGSIQVAVKMLSQTSSQGPNEFQTEAKLLTRIHHRYLVSLIGYCSDPNHLALVYEYMEGGSLRNNLSGKAGINANILSWKERLCIGIEAGQGLEYLHRGCTPAIIHRDIKSSNILLNKNKEAKIGDFGLSRILPNDFIEYVSTKVVGTEGYLDPQYYDTSTTNEKTDVYSFGVVLLELITGRPAIIRDTDQKNILLVYWVKQFYRSGNINAIVDRRLHGNYDANSILKALEAAVWCTSPKWAERPTITEVLSSLRSSLGMENRRHEESTSSGTANPLEDSGISIDPSHENFPESTMNPSAR